MKPADISILIVDDEPLILDILSDLFGAFHFRVHTAISGNAGWSLCQISKYNIILTDIRMPDGDGIELLKKVKSVEGIKPSVLIMSGFSELLNEEIYHLGAEGKFSKPFDINSAKQAIQQCLLAPHIRWSQGLNPAENLTITKKGRDVLELETEKEVLFGRGGFFIAYKFPPPPKGTTIHFDIALESPSPIRFRGAGIIRWIQQLGKDRKSGLGIEILSMGQHDAKLYFDMFGQLTPFIPSFAKIKK